MPSPAQQTSGSPLGTSYGFPGNSSPAFLWPLGNNPVGGPALYPNGPSYGLSNSSGGFGGVGNGTPSAIGAIEPTVSNQQRLEFESANSALLRQEDIFNTQFAATNALLSGITGGVLAAQMSKTEPYHYSAGSITTTLVPLQLQGGTINIDKVLNDSINAANTILSPNMP
jgi:hypothetical protein